MPRPLAFNELRAHPRISAPATAWVTVPNRPRFELPLRDVSRGGAFVLCNEAFAQVGEFIELELALPAGGSSVPLRAQVVRVVEAGIAFQFEELSAGQNTALSAFLARMLLGHGGARRAYPRVAHRVRIRCTGRGDVKAMVRDLSLGGVSLWLDTPVAVGEPLVVSLKRDSGPPLTLHGRVLATQWAREGEPFDQARVAFENVSEESQDALRNYLRELAEG